MTDRPTWDFPVPDTAAVYGEPVDPELLDGVLLVAMVMNIPVDGLYGTERMLELREIHPNLVSPVSGYAPMRRAREWLLNVLVASTGVRLDGLDGLGRLAPTVPRQMRMGFDIGYPVTVLAARAGWEPEWVSLCVRAKMEFAEADRVFRQPGGVKQVRVLLALRGQPDPWAGTAG